MKLAYLLPSAFSLDNRHKFIRALPPHRPAFHLPKISRVTSFVSQTMEHSEPARSARPKIAIVEIGCGTDLHGQDATVAAVRACRNAIEFNSLPGLSRLLPDGDLSKMMVQVRLGVPKEFCSLVQIERVQKQFPYGTVTVEVVEGGLLCSSGIVLPEQGDHEGDDRAIVVVAAVEVAC